LVASNPPTHFLIADSMNWEGGWCTPRTSLSPTQSPWWCDCSEALRTILWGVGHVKVSHPHPSSCASTSSGHVTINLCGIFNFWPLNPVVPRGAALLYVLARKCRVLQGAILKLDGSLWKKTSYYLESSILLSEDSLLWGLYVQLELLLQSFCLELKFFPTHTRSNTWMDPLTSRKFHLKQNSWVAIEELRTAFKNGVSLT